MAHKDFAATSVAVRVDGESEGPTVVLGPGGNIEVILRDADGRLVEAGAVTVADKSGHNLLEDHSSIRSVMGGTHYTDNSGKLMTGPVKPGRYAVFATFDGRRSESVKVTVAREATVGLELTLGDEEDGTR